MRHSSRRGLVITGLLLRTLLMIFMSPVLHEKWFVKFLQYWASNPTIDPWSTWLNSGGDPEAFPYGIGMLLLGIPSGLTAHLFGGQSGSVALTLTFLLCDCLVFKVLNRFNVSDLVIATWAFSPVALFVTYLLGQTDIPLAVSLLMVMTLVRTKRWAWAGALMGFSVHLKLSALLVLPFFVVYAIQSPRNRANLVRFFRSLTLMLLPGVTPVLYSEGFRTMVLGSRETGRLFDYSIQLGAPEPFLLVPVVYFAFLYVFWCQGRTTDGITITFAIAALVSVVLAAPSSVGWYLWGIPSILLLGINPGKTALIFLNIMQIAVVGKALVGMQEIPTRFSTSITIFHQTIGSRMGALLQTIVLVTGLLWIISFVRRLIPQYDRLAIGRTPFSVAIAGDSGTGKDSLTNALKRLFPTGECQVVEGDSYHLYERGAAEWSTLTHLNPLANDLAMMRDDALGARMRNIISPRTYDHRIGRFHQARAIAPGDLVVINGLHALYLNSADHVFDIGVYLEMEESLRCKLKIRRDIESRGVAEHVVRDSLARRRPDAERFIQPQKSEADLIFTILQDHSSSDSEMRLILRVQSIRQSFLYRLATAMTSTVLVSHELKQGGKIGHLELTVDANDLSTDDLRALLQNLEQDLLEVLDPEPNFVAGPLGLESLIVLLAIAEKRRVYGN